MKKMLIGLVCGVLISACTVVYAADAVEALLFPVRVSVNGEIKRLGEEYSVLNYKGHAYLPARFVVEAMGGQVYYDEADQRLSIVDPKLASPGDLLQQSKVLMEYASQGQLKPAAQVIDSFSGKDRDRLFLELTTRLFLNADKPHMGELLQLFIDRKVNLEVRDEQTGNTPLLVLSMQSPAYVPVLLQAGADVNAANSSGHTALMNVSNRGMTDLVQAFLQKGANPNTRDQGGYTPLRSSVLPMFTNFRKETADTVALLLAAGADVNALDSEGSTPLLVASVYVRVSEPVVNLLLDAGADVSVVDSGGQTALHRSVRGGSAELIGRLMERGAPVDGKDKEGNTPLAYAVSEANHVMPDDFDRCKETISLLIKAGANPVSANTEGITPRDRAASLDDERRREQVLELLS